MSFQKKNLNPKGFKANDCVVRALCPALGCSWQEVYFQLYKIGSKKCRMPNEKQVYEALLKEYGWIKQKMPKHDDGTRYTVAELIESYQGPMVISIAHHLTYAIGHTIYDTWDCSNKAVGNYWIQEDNDFCITLDEINDKVRRVLL